MASKNVERLRAAHESWNKRDFAGVVRNAAEGLAYTDHGRNITLNTQGEVQGVDRRMGQGLLGCPHHQSPIH